MAENKDEATADVSDDAAVDSHDVGEPATEAERIAQQAASARPARKQASDGKGHATPKQLAREHGDTERRANPVEFVRESFDELKKVNWPTWNQLQQYFVVVLVFVLILIAFVSAWDLLFGWLLLKAFG